MDLFRFFRKKTIPAEGAYGAPEHLPLDSLLLQIAAAHDSRLLVLRNNGHMGLISLQDGNIVDASFRDQTGEDALAAILSVPQGKYICKERETLPKGRINRPAAVVLHEIQLLQTSRRELHDHLPGAGQPFTLRAFPEDADEDRASVAGAVQNGAADLDAAQEASGLSRLRCEVTLARLIRDGYLRMGMEEESPSLSAPGAQPEPLPGTVHPPVPEGQPTGRRNMKKDPIKSALWGMIVGNIENMGIYPVLQGGEAIARSLEGGTILEKLSEIDGENNYETTTRKNGLTYVVLKACPFTPIYKEIPPWGEKAQKLVAAYNQKPDGGGALHPLCIVHKGIRNALKAGIVSIACRSAAGKVEIAERSLEKADITREEVLEMIDGKGCLFALPEEQA